MISQLPIWYLGFSLMVVIAMSASIALADGQRSGGNVGQPTTQPSPKPELAPKAVTQIVLDAMKDNDANDTGIKTTFKFASPGNQQVTGPIQRFIPMVKGPAYAPMINSRSVEVRELAVEGNSATELGIVVGSNGQTAYFIFQLTKQTDGDFKDCWMTDGVVPVEPARAKGDMPADAPPVAPKPAPKPRDGEFPV